MIFICIVMQNSNSPVVKLVYTHGTKTNMVLNIIFGQKAVLCIGVTLSNL